MGERFDLINVEVEVDHPMPALIKMVLAQPDELKILTNKKVAIYISGIVNDHLSDCLQCQNVARQEVKFY